MNAFQDHGFLAGDDLGFLTALEAQYGGYIKICIDLNSFSQKFQYSLNIHNEYPPEIVASILFSRVLSTYQAAMLLSFKGMKSQVEILIRCILEPLFPLIAISKDIKFTNQLINADECERLKTINKLIRFKTRNKQDGVRELEELALKTKAKIDQNGYKAVSAYDCAVKADLEDYYDTLYSFMSNTLHSSARSLEDSLILDQGKDKITAIKNEPEFDGFDNLYFTLMDCLSRAVIAICVVFSLEEPEILALSHKAIQQLKAGHT